MESATSKIIIISIPFAKIWSKLKKTSASSTCHLHPWIRVVSFMVRPSPFNVPIRIPTSRSTWINYEIIRQSGLFNYSLKHRLCCGTSAYVACGRYPTSMLELIHSPTIFYSFSLFVLWSNRDPLDRDTDSVQLPWPGLGQSAPN